MTLVSPSRVAGRIKLGAAALLAAGILAGSAAPSSAARMWPPQPSLADYEARASSFDHHFWRGTPHRHAMPPRSDMMAVADDAQSIDEEMAYCSSRFKSYDPSTGSYLGYDGNEHPCP